MDPNNPSSNNPSPTGVTTTPLPDFSTPPTAVPTTQANSPLPDLGSSLSNPSPVPIQPSATPPAPPNVEPFANFPTPTTVQPTPLPDFNQQLATPSPTNPLMDVPLAPTAPGQPATTPTQSIPAASQAETVPTPHFDWPPSPANPATPSSPGQIGVQSGSVGESTPQPATPTLTTQDLYGASTPSITAAEAPTPQTLTPAGPVTPEPGPTSQPEPAPTDLSHLVEPGSNNPTLETPISPQAETLVVPANGSSPEPNVPTEAGAHRGIPKWLIGVGIALLLGVAGASAYFILGVGKKASTDAPPTSEAPAPTQPALPLVTQPTVAPVGTESTGFGSLAPETSQSGTIIPTTAPKSAADLLKQKQLTPTP